MKIIKRSTALVLALVMLLLAASCTGKTPETTVQTSAPTISLTPSETGKTDTTTTPTATAVEPTTAPETTTSSETTEPSKTETPATVMTAAEALEAAEGTVVRIKGTVTEFYGTGGKTYGNVYIEDETGTILVYGLYLPDGTRYDAMSEKPDIGDKITVEGPISVYKEVNQLKNATLLELTKSEEPETEVPPTKEPDKTKEPTKIVTTIADALKAPEGTLASLEGTVTEFYGTGGKTYGNMYITDGKNTILIYGLYDKNDTRYDAMSEKPDIGDKISVSGPISVHDNVNQLKDATLGKIISKGTTPKPTETPKETTTPKPTVVPGGAPQEGVAYKLTVNQVSLGQILYFSGEFESRGYYLATTLSAKDAPDVYVEKSGSGFYICFTKNGTKQYISLTQSENNGKTYTNPALTTSKSQVWEYFEDAKTFKTEYNGETYYLGCYNSFDTISVSKISYITGDYADKVDISQFPVRVVEYDPSSEPTTEPKPTVPVNVGDFVFTNDYTPSNYYNGIDGMYGNTLKLKLREIISVQKKTETYDALRTDLAKTDAGSTAGTIRGFYTHKDLPSQWDSGKTWNREHVWPQSKGWFSTGGAGADLHHIRPESSSDNSSRGNKSFGPYNNSTYFCPPDNAKGDVARILFYMLVRYKETDTSYPVTKVAYSMEMLLDWNELDPVDAFEIKRNNETYKIQGNRNPFIDCPDFANYIWDVSRVG